MAWVWSSIAMLGLGSLAGCTAGPNLPPLVPVKGTVKVDSKPVAAGQVSFFPQTVDEKAKFAPPSGQIDSGGNYELFTEGKAGAPAGKYKVMVTPSMVPTQAKGMPKAPFNDKYRDPIKTPLHVEVSANPAPGAYDLKLTP